MSNSRKTVRTPTNITTGTNILKLDPGIYSYEDSNASDEQKLAMGFPKAMWHSEITVTGYWADNNKSTGYINIVVRDCNSDTPRIYENLFSWNEWRGWQSYALKSDLDLKLNNTSIFVGNGGDFGQAIKKAGIVQLNRVGFFICNNPSNSPLENGLIILAHNVGYWNNHPMYIQINGSSISCGTLNCSDYTHITKD